LRKFLLLASSCQFPVSAFHDIGDPDPSPECIIDLTGNTLSPFVGEGLVSAEMVVLYRVLFAVKIKKGGKVTPTSFRFINPRESASTTYYSKTRSITLWLIIAPNIKIFNSKNNM